MLDRTVFLRSARGFHRIARARAAHEDRFLPICRACLGETGIDRFVRGDIDRAEGDADLGGDLLALFRLVTEDGDLDACRCPRPRGLRSAPRGSAGYDR